MKESFVKKTANSFFENKKAIAKETLMNTGGDIIDIGSEVTILGKNYRRKTWLNVQFKDIVINGIHPEELELIKEKEPDSWPIESDTLDLRNHKFNFKK